MTLLKICLVGGWCGNLRYIVAEHIEDFFTQAGIQFKLSHQSVWENPVPPRSFDLVLQLLPAFTEAETGCPVINVKPLLADTNHQPTNGKIMQFIEYHSQVNAGED
jgi:hypothetical protein